jgi:ABC-2 type transport system permease protein
MINTSWLVYTIKRAISALFSGNLIPFAVMPWGLGEILKTFPLGSLGGAPLSIYTGLEEPLKIILVQVLWNTILWPVAHLIFKKAQERMVSQGG